MSSPSPEDSSDYRPTVRCMRLHMDHRLDVTKGGGQATFKNIINVSRLINRTGSMNTEAYAPPSFVCCFFLFDRGVFLGGWGCCIILFAWFCGFFVLFLIHRQGVQEKYFLFRHHNSGLQDSFAIDLYRYYLRYEGKPTWIKAFEIIKIPYNMKATEQAPSTLLQTPFMLINTQNSWKVMDPVTCHFGLSIFSAFITCSNKSQKRKDKERWSTCKNSKAKSEERREENCGPKKEV